MHERVGHQRRRPTPRRGAEIRRVLHNVECGRVHPDESEQQHDPARHPGPRVVARRFALNRPRIHGPRQPRRQQHHDRRRQRLAPGRGLKKHRHIAEGIGESRPRTHSQAQPTRRHRAAQAGGHRHRQRPEREPDQTGRHGDHGPRRRPERQRGRHGTGAKRPRQHQRLPLRREGPRRQHRARDPTRTQPGHHEPQPFRRDRAHEFEQREFREDQEVHVRCCDRCDGSEPGAAPARKLLRLKHRGCPSARAAMPARPHSPDRWRTPSTNHDRTFLLLRRPR